jgi:hypothetical protein
VIDVDGNEWGSVRDLLAREWLIRDEDLAAMPEISRHDEPQVSPQEYECGCVAVTRITDRDSRLGEQPFEMRLALPCGRVNCELVHQNQDRSLSRREMRLYHYAISCALSVLVSKAGRHGRGWYHFTDGEQIVAAEIWL